MADRECEDKSVSSELNEHINEAHPNPHSEQDVARTPIPTNHGAATHENAAQSTSTAENRLSALAAPNVEDSSGDSMFNNADPQTKEILKKDNAKQNRGHRRPKAA